MGYQRRVHGESTRACRGMTKIRILLAIVLFVCLVATSEGQRRKKGGNPVCKRDCSKSKGRERQKCIQRKKRANCKKGNKEKSGGEKPKRDGKPKHDGKPNRDGRTKKGGNNNKGGQRDGNKRLKDPVMMRCDGNDHKCLKVPDELVKELTIEAVERALDNFNATSMGDLLLSRVGIDEKDDPYKEKKPNRSGKSNQSINPMGCKKKCNTKHKGKPKKNSKSAKENAM